MNFEMVKRWNAIVRPNDHVWVLGDFSLQFSYVEQFVPLLLGNLHLVMGNHDKCHPASCRKSKDKKEKEAQMKDAYLKAGFKSVQTTAYHQIGKHLVQLHHFPFKGSGDSDYVERYTEYRPKDKGQWLLNGHVHHAWRQKGRCINVGVDRWDFKPVSQLEIQQIIEYAPKITPVESHDLKPLKLPEMA